MGEKQWRKWCCKDQSYTVVTLLLQPHMYISVPKINMNKQICGHQLSSSLLNSQYFGKGYELEETKQLYML